MKLHQTGEKVWRGAVWTKVMSLSPLEELEHFETLLVYDAKRGMTVWDNTSPSLCSVPRRSRIKITFFSCFCHCWQLQDIQPHFKLFTYSHSRTARAAGWLLEIPGPHTSFQTCAKIGLEQLWCRPRGGLKSPNTERDSLQSPCSTCVNWSEWPLMEVQEGPQRKGNLWRSTSELSWQALKEKLKGH